MTSRTKKRKPDFIWRVVRTQRERRNAAMASLKSEGFTIHDHYDASAANEMEEYTIIAKKAAPDSE